jgi:hypothetical protein
VRTKVKITSKKQLIPIQDHVDSGAVVYDEAEQTATLDAGVVRSIESTHKKLQKILDSSTKHILKDLKKISLELAKRTNINEAELEEDVYDIDKGSKSESISVIRVGEQGAAFEVSREYSDSIDTDAFLANGLLDGGQYALLQLLLNNESPFYDKNMRELTKLVCTSRKLQKATEARSESQTLLNSEFDGFLQRIGKGLSLPIGRAA